jgi:SAM-dependent methyltransferase
VRISFHREPDYHSLVNREGEIWGEAKSDVGISWFDSRMICRYINQCVSGNPQKDWLDYIKDQYFRIPASLALTAGCGHGELERLILRRGIAEKIDGFDISLKAIERARALAEEEGFGGRIRYFHADANYLEKACLPDHYDVVIAAMALHHFAELEKSLDALNARLKPGGLFITNEFIGATRFQWTERQLEAANRFLACIPSDLKKNIRSPDQIKYHVIRPSVEYMKKHMAFESICSERIIPALEECFDIVERKNYGGTILHLLFEAIMGNFDEELNREHAVIVRMAIEYEKALLDYGALEHDHALVICRKR